jgi:hypothetical protein
VVILKIEGASAFHTLPAIVLEDREAHLTGDWLPPSPRFHGAALIDIEQHVRAIQSLGRPSLPVSDQGEHISFPVSARLPVKISFEPPPDAPSGLGHLHGSVLLGPNEGLVVCWW